MSNNNEHDDIETWRDVHRHLTLAIIQSRDNIAAELAKRRYLLEEINRSPAGGGPPKNAVSSSQGNSTTPATATTKNVEKKKRIRKLLPMPYIKPSPNDSLPTAQKKLASVEKMAPVPHSKSG